MKWVKFLLVSIFFPWNIFFVLVETPIQNIPHFYFIYLFNPPLSFYSTFSGEPNRALVCVGLTPKVIELNAKKF